MYGELSESDLLVLRTISQAKRIEGLAKSMKVPPATLGRTVARLQLEGYISDTGGLTEKGREAIEK
jgi:DNA-binding MarR family transcriptional regulator